MAWPRASAGRVFFFTVCRLVKDLKFRYNITYNISALVLAMEYGEHHYTDYSPVEQPAESKAVGVETESHSQESIAESPEQIIARLPEIPAEQHNQIALELIEAGHGNFVTRNLGSFEGLDHNGVARSLIATDQHENLGSNLHKLRGLDSDIAFWLIENKVWGGGAVARNLGSFEGLNHSEVARRLVATGQNEALEANFVRFEGLENSIVVSIVANEPALLDYVLSSCKGLNHSEFAEGLVKVGMGHVVAFKLSHFKSLGRSVAVALAERGYGRYVMGEADRFEDLDRATITMIVECMFHSGDIKEADKVIKEMSLQFAPDSIAAIYLDESVPKEIRQATETYARGVSIEHQRARLTHGMSPIEYKDALERHPELADSKKPLEDAFACLLEREKGTSGEVAEIYFAMRGFGDLFGAEVSMKFANRPGLSRHDAFMAHGAAASFVSLQDESYSGNGGWYDSPNYRSLVQSFSRVLLEVASDDSRYQSGGTELNANQWFNQVVAEVDICEIKDLLDEASQLGLPGLDERIAKLREPRFNPLESWKGLKDLADIRELMARGEIVAALRSPELPASVKSYAGSLMAHPNIPMERLTRFLEQPKAFLDGRGQYVNDGLQQALSPARMAEVERLGLTPVEIRDALTDGTLDRLQILPPMEESYRLGEDGYELKENNLNDEVTLQAGFDRGVGRRRENVAGTAQDPKGLFAELSKWGQKYGLSRDDCAAWIRGGRSLPEGADLAALAAVLYDRQRGIPEPEQEKSVEVRVRVGRKSDPDMVVAGNDTASCMPFGDGKTNVYAWGPAFSQLVVERKNEKGEWRTMAQSVLSLAFDAGRPSTEVMNGLHNGKTLNNLISVESFAKQPKVMSDNLEPSPNDIEAGRGPLIQNAYTKFMRSYLERHAAALGVDPSEVIVGRETYLDQDRWNLPHVENTFVPLAPLSYTDNNGDKSYRVETGLKPAEPRQREAVSEVTAADVMPMALLEGKNYADNPDLAFGLYDRQHKIVGGAIAAEKHGDPKLSLISRDERGVPVGYMVAYVDRTTDVPEIFLDDMAVDRSRNVLAARHAAKLIDAFMERYASHGRDSAKPLMPIYAQMRESTSYRLMTRQIENLASKLGLAYEVVEEGDIEQGGEPFKCVRIFMGQDESAVEASKKAFAARRPIEQKSEGEDLEAETDGEENEDEWQDDDDDSDFDGGND